MVTLIGAVPDDDGGFFLTFRNASTCSTRLGSVGGTRSLVEWPTKVRQGFFEDII